MFRLLKRLSIIDFADVLSKEQPKWSRRCFAPWGLTCIYYAMQFTWTRFCELLWQIRSTLDLYVQMHTTFLEKWKTKPFFFTRLNKLIRETSKFEILSIIPNCPINGPFRGMSQWMNSDVVDRANICDLVIAGGREIGRKFNENNEGERRNELRYSEVAKITNTDRWTQLTSLAGSVYDVGERTLLYCHDIETRYRYRYAEICRFRSAGNSFFRRYRRYQRRFVRVPGPNVRYRTRSIGYSPPLSPILGLTIALSRSWTRAWPVCKFLKRRYYVPKTNSKGDRSARIPAGKNLGGYSVAFISWFSFILAT